MGTSFRIKPDGLLHSVWTVIRRAASFLTTLIILVSVCITVLFLAGIKPYVVLTGSMEPAIPVNSVCFVNEHTPLSDIAVGDVISFHMGELLVTHRVTEISDGAYTTKGDANSINDASPVTKQNYIGKTICIVPGIGVLFVFLQSKTGKLAAAVLIALVIVLSFLPSGEVKENAGKE